MSPRIQGHIQHAPTYTLDEIRQYTQPNKPSGFRRFLGSLAGGVANAFAPGAGSLIQRLISGGSGLSGGILGDMAGYIELQRQVQAEARAFETASTILKVKHDAAMSAIRNMKS